MDDESVRQLPIGGIAWRGVGRRAGAQQPGDDVRLRRAEVEVRRQAAGGAHARGAGAGTETSWNQ